MCLADMFIIPGIGRSASLKYSELGYTVFALCPDRQRPLTGRPRSSNVSSVSTILSIHEIGFIFYDQILYAWHLKKERSPNHSWGLIAPIVVDVTSKADRLRAFETVKAYCSDHALNLVALIIFPPTYQGPSEPSSPHLTEIPLDFPKLIPQKLLPLNLAKDDVWQDSVFREVTEPVLIAQEYVRLLRKSSGRVIIVSGCTEGRFSCKSIKQYWSQ